MPSQLHSFLVTTGLLIGADQPFGLPETVGTVLVLAAAAVELSGAPSVAPLSPQTAPRA